jgi:coatomer protein complex subunit alpha (xenin)
LVCEISFLFLKNFIEIFFLAEVRKDVSGQFQIAMLLGDVEERVKLLKQCNQSKI